MRKSPGSRPSPSFSIHGHARPRTTSATPRMTSQTFTLKSCLYKIQNRTVDAHDPHQSFIKTPQQLIVVILLSFLVPIIGIILVVQLVLSRPGADPQALAPEAVASRIQPVARLEFGAPPAAPGTRAVVHLANQAGANFKAPAAPKEKPAPAPAQAAAAPPAQTAAAAPAHEAH